MSPRHRINDIPRIVKILRAEEYPQNGNAKERHAPVHNVRESDVQPPPLVVHHESYTVHRAPEHERPACTVPESDNEHGNEQIAHLCPLPMAIAAERDIEVLTHPEAERHVPSAPEVDDAPRLIRRIEVHGEFQIEHKPQTDRHLTVAGKIKVELKGIGERSNPRLKKRNCVRMRKDIRHPWRKAIRNHHLFEQPHDEDGQPERDIVVVDAKCTLRDELRHHILVIQNRACYQMGENRHEFAIGHKRMITCLTAIGINQISRLGKGKKRDTKRKHNVRQVKTCSNNIICRRQKEIRVLEIPKQDDIDDNAKDEPRFRVRLLDPLPDKIVEQNRGKEQRYIAIVPIPVKDKGCQHEPEGRIVFLREPSQPKKSEKSDREEQKNELIGIEQHGAHPFNFRFVDRIA